MSGVDLAWRCGAGSAQKPGRDARRGHPGGMDFDAWLDRFCAEAGRREASGDPVWGAGAVLDPWVVRSIQRFQVGEDGDGASLIGKAERAGDPAYLAAVRLFVAEERNHARMLARLLAAGGAPVIRGHWSDAAFVALRRALGLRWELMILMLAEVVALRYYRALRDGTGDPLLTEVAGRILADEQRHVPFHCDRLRAGFGRFRWPVRVAVAAGWWMALYGAVVVVAHGHGRALRRLGVTRRRFVADAVALFGGVVADVLRPGAPSGVLSSPVRPLYGRSEQESNQG